MSFLQGPADFWQTIAESSPAANMGKKSNQETVPAIQPAQPNANDALLEFYKKETNRKRGLAQVSSGRGTNSYPESGVGSAMLIG